MSKGSAAPRPRIVCLIGPTASGKSELALEIAARLGGEIVAADSRQVYRHLEIGTAKPTAAERARVPHHCLDLVEPEAAFDAARYRTVAARVIADIQRRGALPLVVGGTGLYVRALLHGLCPAPPRVPALRAVLERAIAERGTAAVHRGLAAVDPPAAARIGRGDGVRLVRALEVALSTGLPLSRLQAEHAFGTNPYDALCVGLLRPVDELNARIDRRVFDMVRAGFLDEVRMLRRRGVAPGAPGLAAVGYREMLACADGALSLDEAIAAVARATRRFAKRQRTWFRRERGVVWRHPTRDRARIDDEVAVFLASGERPGA